MKILKATAALLVGAAGLACASAASAAAVLYDLNVWAPDKNFSGTLGTVSVEGQGGNELSFLVTLDPSAFAFFQMQGSSSQASPNQIFWFDLNGLNPLTDALTFTLTQPNAAGDYPTDGKVAVSYINNGFGMGWSVGYDYGATAGDDSRGSDLNYFPGPLAFTVKGADSLHLSLASRDLLGSTVYGGADLRQCPTTDPKVGPCVTGPVGFTEHRGDPTQTAVGVPEPATWALMLVGFGLIGGAMRRRNQHRAVRLTYA